MPTISHSQMETWQECPQKWKLQKIDHIKESAQPLLLLGRAVHSAIEADNKTRIAGGNPLDHTALVERASHALRDELAAHHPEDDLAAKLPILRAKAEAMLAAYVREVQPRYTPLTAERSFRFPLPDVPGWSFTGRTDALATDAEGQVVLLDYKTADHPWRPGKEHRAQQATAYTWALQEQGQAISGVAFIPLSALHTWNGYIGHAQIRLTHRGVASIASYRALAAATIAAISTAKSSGDYPARPSPLCRWCPVAHACPIIGKASVAQASA